MKLRCYVGLGGWGSGYVCIRVRDEKKGYQRAGVNYCLENISHLGKSMRQTYGPGLSQCGLASAVAKVVFIGLRMP